MGSSHNPHAWQARKANVNRENIAPPINYRSISAGLIGHEKFCLVRGAIVESHQSEENGYSPIRYSYLTVWRLLIFSKPWVQYEWKKNTRCLPLRFSPPLNIGHFTQLVIFKIAHPSTLLWSNKDNGMIDVNISGLFYLSLAFSKKVCGSTYTNPYNLE